MVLISKLIENIGSYVATHSERLDEETSKLSQLSMSAYSKYPGPAQSHLHHREINKQYNDMRERLERDIWWYSILYGKQRRDLDTGEQKPIPKV